MPEINDLSKSAAGLARDAAYVVVGLGVLGIQRAQVRRQQLQRTLEHSDVERTFVDLRANVVRGVQDVDQLVEQTIEHLEAGLEPLERQLPGAVRSVVDQAHSQAREARGQLRQLVRHAV